MAVGIQTDTQTQHDGNESLVRFDIHQRIQHILMLTSFTMLAITGLPQKFNTWSLSQWWVNLLGGIDMVRDLHHFFAFVMLGDGVYHGLYLFVRSVILKHPFPISMIPTPKDFQDAIQDFRHFVGLSREEPKFDRFNWREKFDYWAVFWGVPVLGASGLILMFPEQASRILPGIAIPVALIAHSDEAFLAVAWIFGVHLFFVHLPPNVFPLNKSIFTGRISKARLQKEHPLEWEKIQASQRDVDQEAGTPSSGTAEELAPKRQAREAEKGEQ